MDCLNAQLLRICPFKYLITFLFFFQLQRTKLIYCIKASLHVVLMKFFRHFFYFFLLLLADLSENKCKN